ncbi:MAG: methionyl-tRNA formyltransferase [Ignavibacteriaceae bacterium]|nr:MAG: methionyl-tRNA formyltransferase [Chlorobi bacterium OLB4]MBW7856209.1 methionyl-tRNA formyltransferase [Ignavibacteria bacterium]MEB2329139.1 methionyl-tRNA formyltransferase [Ignavibacteriaceae bacterium]
MNIVYMGTPEFAIPTLEAIYHSHHKISAVVTVPDRQRGRGQKLCTSPVKDFAIARGITVLQPERLKSNEFTNRITEISPDLIVVVAFRILPERIISIPRYGAINLHASLLPKYRGAAPINRAIMNGETETGVTTFFLDKNVDTGNIILQEKIQICDDDNATTLHDKLKLLGAEVVLRTLELIESGNYTLQKQRDVSATMAPKIFKEDCRIDWSQNAISIHNKIRGLSLYPAAWTTFNGKTIKIFSSKITALPSPSESGKIVINDKKLFVHTIDLLIEVTELQLEGKSKVTAHDFINGLREKSNLFFR